MEDITIDNTVDDINIIKKKQVSQTNNTSNLPNPIVVNPVPIVVNPISNTTNEKESNAIQPILSFKPITQNITTTKKGEEKDSDHDNTPINILVNKNNSNNNDKIDNKSKEKSNEVINNEVLDEEVIDNEVLDNEVIEDEVIDNEVLDEVSNNEVSNNEVSNSSISYSKDESFNSNYSEDKEVTEEKTDLSSKTV